MYLTKYFSIIKEFINFLVYISTLQVHSPARKKRKPTTLASVEEIEGDEVIPNLPMLSQKQTTQVYQRRKHVKVGAMKKKVAVESQTPLVTSTSIPQPSERLIRTTTIPTSSSTTDAAMRKLVLEELKLKKKVLIATVATPTTPDEPRPKKKRLILKSSHRNPTQHEDRSFDDF